VIEAAHKVVNLKVADDFAIMSRFFMHWVDSERLRKKRLKTKYTGVMLSLVRFTE
jgi:hypothetical protein